MGQGYLALASDERTLGEKRLAHWREARSWFQKSQKIYQVFRDGGKLTGDATRLDVVTQEIAKCEAYIDGLSGNNQ